MREDYRRIVEHLDALTGEGLRFEEKDGWLLVTAVNSAEKPIGKTYRIPPTVVQHLRALLTPEETGPCPTPTRPITTASA